MVLMLCAVLCTRLSHFEGNVGILTWNVYTVTAFEYVDM